MKEFILLKFQYKLSFIVFLSLAPSALISWPERGTPRNPSSSLATSISVPSLTSRHMLCRIQQVIIVEGTLSTDSSSLSSGHRHLPFNSPNTCSTTTLALLRGFIKISLPVGQGSGLMEMFHALGRQFVSWVSNYKWLNLHTAYPTQWGMQNIAVFYCCE